MCASAWGNFNINMLSLVSYQYLNSHYNDKTAMTVWILWWEFLYLGKRPSIEAVAAMFVLYDQIMA